ncbi:MAG: hypothetical protein GX113_05120 [Actinobacteria bacterium]|jgi:hypothetical protein|nr:hypothetical protein [Actinomycetota bacterium]
MLLNVDTEARLATKVRSVRLSDFELDERGLQDIFFRALDRLFPDEELLLIMQSRRWREEPDLMALDAEGTLYIFELKAWESHPENILQALRYGQIYGQYNYDQLDELFRSFHPEKKSLRDAHQAAFGVALTEDDFNAKQAFVVMTNGMDYKTREAVQYWRSRGLNVRPWIYRVYRDAGDKMLLEVSRFATVDDPYEDLQEGYYIVNTNYNNDTKDHDMMLKERVVAAFFTPWKQKIARISKGDVVFLYQSGAGIVAVGVANGKLKKRPYQGNPEYPDEEFSVPLAKFQTIEEPISAAEIKEICGVNYRFRSTLFSIDAESGRKLDAAIRSRTKSK